MQRILLLVTLAGTLAAGCQPSNKPAVEDLSGVPPVSDTSAPVAASPSPINNPPNSVAATTRASSKEEIERYLTWLQQFDTERAAKLKESFNRMNAAQAASEKAPMDTGEEVAAGLQPVINEMKVSEDLSKKYADYFRTQSYPPECANMAHLYQSYLDRILSASQSVNAKEEAVLAATRAGTLDTNRQSGGDSIEADAQSFNADKKVFVQQLNSELDTIDQRFNVTSTFRFNE